MFAYFTHDIEIVVGGIAEGFGSGFQTVETFVLRSFEIVDLFFTFFPRIENSTGTPFPYDIIFVFGHDSVIVINDGYKNIKIVVSLRTLAEISRCDVSFMLPMSRFSVA